MDNVIAPFSTIVASGLAIGQILALDQLAFGAEYAWHWNNFTHPLPDKYHLSFVALSSGQVHGFVIASVYQHKDGPMGHINRIAVTKAIEGHGVGSALMRQVHRACKGIPVAAITLEFDASLPVQPFYERLGYAQLTDATQLSDYLTAKNKPVNAPLYTTGQRKVFIHRPAQ